MMQSEDGQNTLIDGIYVLGTDHLGTPMRAWDRSTAQPVWAADIEPFGRAWEYIPDSREAPTLEVNLRRPGQFEDRESGLFQNWHRTYSPDLGSFISPDPMITGVGASRPMGPWMAMTPGGTNPYHYALNSPLNNSDPTGLVCCAEEHAKCVQAAEESTRQCAEMGGGGSGVVTVACAVICTAMYARGVGFAACMQECALIGLLGVSGTAATCTTIWSAKLKACDDASRECVEST